ncbi:F-box/WD-40 repeat-containing protein At5g21040-like [Olea europaea var. sylvestris]|uniref:F-box/WD-40 repeat-containing protein At5g21040-like n=1 Tax=Olea europaea var. sylvestris TaxID=158386 RepID=UPI000C1CF39E|nr:F-box/WD-40 repeat-containing protein At5g21040-like [Olea europaea var. sylvestris]
MAFECHQTVRIGSKDTSIDCLDNPPAEEVDKRQVISTNNIKNFTSESDNPKYTSILNANTPSVNESLPNYIRSITDLPPALISEILNCLDPKELGIVSCVNTYLYRLASEHHVWKEFYCERWGHPITLANFGPGNSDERSWKELFVDRDFHSKTFMGRFSIDTLYGHTEAIRAVFVLASKKIVFTSGYDQIVRMWDMEEGLSIASSRPLGCTIRALAADTKVLVAGGTDGFIHGWKADDGNAHLFDLCAPKNQNMEFRVWEHEGPITCLALDFGKIYSGSWDMTICIWDRSSLKCLKVLVHNDWVWSLVPHDTILMSAAGSDVHLWDINSGTPLAIINNAHVGNAYSLACSHTGKLIFTGGEDGSIHMFEIIRNAKCSVRKIATWLPHTGSVYSLAFEFPWLVSASSDGKISLIDVRKLLKKTSKHSSIENPFKGNHMDKKHVEPPQRMLHGFGCNLFSVGIGCDRIVGGGEEGVVRIWNFSQALEIEQRVRTLRGIRLENRMRRRKLQAEISCKGRSSEQCLVAAKKNQTNGDRNGWHYKHKVTGKLKGQS